MLLELSWTLASKPASEAVLLLAQILPKSLPLPEKVFSSEIQNGPSHHPMFSFLPSNMRINTIKWTERYNEGKYPGPSHVLTMKGEIFLGNKHPEPEKAHPQAGSPKSLFHRPFGYLLASDPSSLPCPSLSRAFLETMFHSWEVSDKGSSADK